MKIIVCIAMGLGISSCFVSGTEDKSVPTITLLECNKSNDEDFNHIIELVDTCQIMHIKSTLGTLSRMPNLSRLTVLHSIDVSSNNLTSLEWIKQVPLLINLKAGNNKIVSIEPVRGSLLEKINLNRNQITDIAPILACDQLKKVSFYGNPLHIEDLENTIEILKQRSMTPHLAKIIYKLLLCNHRCAFQKMRNECKDYWPVLFSANFDKEDQEKLLFINDEAKKFKELSLKK